MPIEDVHKKKNLQMRGVGDGRNNGASNVLGWVD
jgi:hypothetical protein